MNRAYRHWRVWNGARARTLTPSTLWLETGVLYHIIWWIYLISVMDGFGQIQPCFFICHRYMRYHTLISITIPRSSQVHFHGASTEPRRLRKKPLLWWVVWVWYCHKYIMSNFKRGHSHPINLEKQQWDHIPVHFNQYRKKLLKKL